jgi:hypothetical protein
MGHHRHYPVVLVPRFAESVFLYREKIAGR